MSRPVAAFVLQAHTDLNVLSGFNSELAMSLSSMGIDPVFVDFSDESDSIDTINKTLMHYSAERIVGAFSFSGIGMEVGDASSGGNIWREIKVPALSLMLDHPCYIMHRHTLPDPAVARLYPTMDFIDFQRDYIKAPGRNIHCRMGAFMHGHTPSRREISKDAAPLIIFPKLLGNPDNIKEAWKRLPTHIEHILRNAVDHYWGETSRCNNVVQSVIIAGRAACIELQSDLPLSCFLISQIDHYFRTLKATLLIKELLNLPIEIYGKGFNHIHTEGARAKLLPALDYREVLEKMRVALAVISMNPNIGDDCHDRIYHAFGAGALPISDINPWWAKTFPTLQPYSYNFCDKPVTAAIEKVLSDPQAAAETAWNLGQEMREQRPFKKAVAEAVDWALMQRYFEFNFISPLDIFVRADLS